RENQVDLVVFQFGQLINEEVTDGILVHTVGPADVVQHPRRQFARAFELAGKSFDQLRQVCTRYRTAMRFGVRGFWSILTGALFFTLSLTYAQASQTAQTEMAMIENQLP